MTRNFATRALLIVGLLIAGTISSYAQMTSQVRRVAPGKEHLQPVAAAAVALNSTSMSLTADQRAQLSTVTAGAVALQDERTRLWSEYNAIINRPDFDDDMAAAEAAPRMLRIVAINSEIASMVARQDAALKSVLSTSQQSELARIVSQFRTTLAK